SERGHSASLRFGYCATRTLKRSRPLAPLKKQRLSLGPRQNRRGYNDVIADPKAVAASLKTRNASRDRSLQSALPNHRQRQRDSGHSAPAPIRPSPDGNRIQVQYTDSPRRDSSPVPLPDPTRAGYGRE